MVSRFPSLSTVEWTSPSDVAVVLISAEKMLRCHAFPVEDAGDWMSEYPRGSAVGLVTTATAEVGGGKVGCVDCYGG